MATGIQNYTNITVDNITSIVNVTNVPELFINVNHDIFNGWYFFVIFALIWIILFIAANKVRDQILNNAMYSGAVVSVLSFIVRAIEVTKHGVVRGLLTDHQMWMFPVITMVIAGIIWATKDR